MSHGVAEVPELANQLLRNLEAVLSAVRTFASEASPELLVAMIANMPADVHRMQDEVNPSDSPPSAADGPGEAASICIEQGLDVGASESKYCRYATGFYLGYGAFLAVELASGAKALVKGVRKAGDLAKKIKDATDDIGSIKGALKAGKASLAETISRQVVVADGGSPNIDGPAVREALDDLGADTASAKTKGIQALHSVDDGAADLGKLSSREHAKLASRLYRTGDTDDAIAFAKQLEDAEDLRYLADEDVGTLQQLADWHQNPSEFRLIDSDMTASSFVKVARGGDVHRTVGAVRPQSPADLGGTTIDAVWLEKGRLSQQTVDSPHWVRDSGGSGWIHIRNNHLRAEGGSENHFLQYGSRYGDEEAVQELTMNAVKYGDPYVADGGGLFYVYRVPDTERHLSVLVGDNGYIVTVKPTDVR